MSDHSKRVEELKAITFSEWQPKDKYWIIALVEGQEGEIERLKAEKWLDQVFKLEETFHRQLTEAKEEIKECQEALDNSDLYLHEALDRLGVPSSKRFPGKARDGVIARVEDALTAANAQIERLNELGSQISQDWDLKLTAAKQEIERLKEANEHWHTVVSFHKKDMDQKNAEIEKQQEFIEYLRDAMHLAVSPELRVIADQVLKGDYSWADE